MPFATEFDDVYATIKDSVVGALSKECRCFRLDELRPAGRITDRLLQELKTASLCVADLTGNRPNVMWEVGYAMALNCPIVIVTQKLNELPFDIRDMQSHEYDRSRLNSTLRQPLERMIADTISFAKRPAGEQEKNDLVGKLLIEVSELKNMVAQSVRSWAPTKASSSHIRRGAKSELKALEGFWINKVGGSHLYGKIIHGELFAPYCYAGNESLTGVYYGWRKTGDYWFARYAWLTFSAGGVGLPWRKAGPSGFAFLKQESKDNISGAWWGDEELDGVEPADQSAPPSKAGVAAVWERSKGPFPLWARRFLADVERCGWTE